MRSVAEVRSWMCKREAEIAIRVSDSRNLRAGMKSMILVGQAVEIFIPSLKRWYGGYRCVGECDSHIIVEKGKILKRHPMCWSRARLGPHRIISPILEDALNNSASSNELAEPAVSTFVLDGFTPLESHIGSTKVSTENILIDSHAEPCEFTCAADFQNDAIKEKASVSSGDSKLSLAVNQWSQPMPGAIINTVSGRVGTNLNGVDAFLEIESEDSFADLVNKDPICSEEIYAVEDSSLSLEAENELLSFTNPSRIAPKIFMQIPDALDAIKKELQTLLTPDKQGLPALLCVQLDDSRYQKISRIRSTMIVK